jgi:general secretion pathway protein J
LKRSAAGFTLIEMLVAIAVFGLVAAAGAGLAGAAMDNQQRMEGADAAYRDLQTARLLMKADFAQATARPVRDAFGRAERWSFAGGVGADSIPRIAFVRGGWTNPAGQDRRASLQYVTYEVRDDVLVRISRARLDAAPDTPVTETTLLRGVKAASITFFTKGQWLPQWRGTVAAAVPEVVAIDLDLAGVGRVRQLFRTPAI